MGSRVMSWLILVESMSVQHTLHHFPNFVASAATGLPATTASPNSAVRRSGRSVSGTAKAAATPKAASRNPARRRECLIVTIVACCFEPWAKVWWKSAYQSHVVWMVLDSVFQAGFFKYPVVNNGDKVFFILKQQ